MKSLLETQEWRDLVSHYNQISSESMQTWFREDAQRANRFSLAVGDLMLDYSKNRLTQQTLSLFENLSHAIQLPQKIDQLFSGHPVNFTEKRAALHTALRNFQSEPVYVNGKDVMPGIRETIQKIEKFSNQIRDGKWLGATGKPLKHIVNVGIGGSHLGPLTVLHALKDFCLPGLTYQFISKVDGTDLNNLFNQIDPEVTLFIISSKTFTTIETLTNAKTIYQWLKVKLGTSHLQSHFVAVTASPNKAIEWGIPNDQIFPIWDWVGGRYSVWSAIGLPIAILLGMDLFLEFLKGGHHMDEHFRKAPLLANMPVILAYLGVWYINFYQASSHAIIPYSENLNFLPDYLQQLDMESNGKGVSYLGAPINYSTGPIIWGNHGSDGQHAFLQLIHQSPHLIPIDFILVGQSNNNLQEHQDLLVASALSQTKALLQGKTKDEAYKELIDQGYSEETATLLAAHKTFSGNRPSSTLFINKISPFNLGSLIALYEHKVYVQGCIWGINSFDQWGVELGKQLLPDILQDLKGLEHPTGHDSSTNNLITHYQTLRCTSENFSK